jgi:hypothetical protein
MAGIGAGAPKFDCVKPFMGSPGAKIRPFDASNPYRADKLPKPTIKPVSLDLKPNGGDHPLSGMPGIASKTRPFGSNSSVGEGENGGEAKPTEKPRSFDPNPYADKFGKRPFDPNPYK